jgi:hypothetical protein
MVMVEVGEASVLGLLGKGKSALPSPIRVVGSPLMGPPIMVHCRSSGSPRGGVRDDGARTISEGGEAQAAESVGDELNTLKADGFTKGENISW